jgi:hypothetical protein
VDGYEVEIGQLRDASKAAGSTADQARAVQPGSGLGAIAVALSGGDAARIVSTLASTFDECATGWTDEIDRSSETVSAAAKQYSENEDPSQDRPNSTRDECRVTKGWRGRRSGSLGW